MSGRLFDPAKVIVVDLLAYRLDKAKEMGADQAVNAAKIVASEVIEDLTKGRRADASIEAVGIDETL